MDGTDDSHVDFQRRLHYERMEAQARYDAGTAPALSDEFFYQKARLLLPSVASRIGMKEQQLTRRMKAVRLVHDPEVNCLVRHSRDWKVFELHVNSGFAMFIHKMAKLFATRIAIGSNVPQRRQQPTISLDSTVAMARRLMQAFWDGSLLDQGSIRMEELSDSQLFIAGLLVDYGERFAISHEFGHVVIGISGKSDEREAVESALAAHGVRGSQASFWAEEMAADIIGLKLSFAVPESVELLVVWAAEFCLILWDMVITFHERVHGHRPAQMHPPASMRLATLRSVVNVPKGHPLSQGGHAMEQLANLILTEACKGG